jgi:hypothetical protein
MLNLKKREVAWKEGLGMFPTTPRLGLEKSQGACNTHSDG